MTGARDVCVDHAPHGFDELVVDVAKPRFKLVLVQIRRKWNLLHKTPNVGQQRVSGKRRGGAWIEQKWERKKSRDCAYVKERERETMGRGSARVGARVE